MVSKDMLKLGRVRSAIRELFEFGRKRAAIVGGENVYDFSIGNPSVPPPAALTEEMVNLLSTCDPSALHGYTSAPGANERGTRLRAISTAATARLLPAGISTSPAARLPR
ncbi:MAG: hypothetical protein R2912_11190 [Eubacteriales bacterium]